MNLRVCHWSGQTFCRRCLAPQYESRLLERSRQSPARPHHHWKSVPPNASSRIRLTSLVTLRPIHTSKSKKPKIEGVNQLKTSSARVENASDDIHSEWAPSPLSAMAGEDDFVFESSAIAGDGAHVELFKAACKLPDVLLETRS